MSVDVSIPEVEVELPHPRTLRIREELPNVQQETKNEHMLLVEQLDRELSERIMALRANLLNNPDLTISETVENQIRELNREHMDRISKLNQECIKNHIEEQEILLEENRKKIRPNRP